MKAFFDKIDAPSAIAITLIVAVVALMFVLVFHGVPDSNVFNLVVGSMLTLAGTIVTFYFGSSSGSKDKDKASADTLKGAVQALSDNQAPGNGSGGVKAVLALFAVLCLLSFAQPAHAQLAVTGNPVKDLATDRANIAKRAATTATSAATSTADDVLAALAKPFQDLATFIGNDIDAAVALSTAIPALQDGNGQQCWMGMQQFAAVVNAHPVPLTLKVATDLEALRLSMMAANNLCANPHCTQVFADLSNGVQQLAVGIGGAIPVPSLNAVCSKVPQIAVVAAAPVPATPVPAAAKP